MSMTFKCRCGEEYRSWQQLVDHIYRNQPVRLRRGNEHCCVRATIETLAQYQARYLLGKVGASYPVPAMHVDCVADLGERWSNWLDHAPRRKS